MITKNKNDGLLFVKKTIDKYVSTKADDLTRDDLTKALQ
jgi:hypothetical protein